MKENYCHTLNNIYIYTYNNFKTNSYIYSRQNVSIEIFEKKIFDKEILLSQTRCTHHSIQNQRAKRSNKSAQCTLQPINIYIKIAAYSMVCSIPLGRVANGLKRVRTAENQNRGWRHKFGQRNLFVKSNVYHR